MGALDKAFDYGNAIANIGLGIHDQEMQNKSTKTANALSEAAQKRALRQEKEMSDTAHQREVEDLRAAGLNPVLSAGGQGASTAAVGGGGFQVRQSLAAKIASSAQAAAAAAMAMKTKADGQIAQASAAVAKDVATATRDAAVANAQTAANNARVSSVDADFMDSPWGRGVNAVKRTAEAFGAVVNPIRGALFGSAQRTGRVERPTRINVIRDQRGGDNEKTED